MYKLFKIDCTTVKKNKLGNNLKEFFLWKFNNRILVWIVSESGGSQTLPKILYNQKKREKRKSDSGICENPNS